MCKYKSALIMSVLLLSPLAFGTLSADQITAITTAVSFDTVLTGIAAIAAVIAGIFVALKGARYLFSLLH